MLSVKKNDRVKILWGKDRGKEGEVIAIEPRKGRLIVGKANVAKRHTRPMGQQEPGGIKDKELYLPFAKVMLICPDCKKAMRPKFDSLTDGTSVRLCRKCGSTIAESKKK
jgi:large subunit ribosomal protein L24